MFRGYSGTTLDNFIVAYKPETSIFNKRKLPESWYQELYVCLSSLPEIDHTYMVVKAREWAASHYLRPLNELIIISGLLQLEDLSSERLVNTNVQEASPLEITSALGENAHLRRSEFKIDRAYTFDKKTGMNRVDDLQEFYCRLVQTNGDLNIQGLAHPVKLLIE